MDIPRILIVDDEDEVREALKNLLFRRLESQLNEAADGKKALELLSSCKFDLVVLDVRMPGLSGIDVLKTIHQHYTDTIVFVITAYDSTQVAREVFASGAVEYLIKPITVDLLFSKISEALKQKSKFFPKVFLSENLSNP